MSVVLLTIALVLADAPPTRAEPTGLETLGQARCKTTATVAGAKRSGGGLVGKLGDLPPAAQIQTVWRQVDGCPTPVVLRDGIGTDTGAERPAVSADGQVLRAY